MNEVLVFKSTQSIKGMFHSLSARKCRINSRLCVQAAGRVVLHKCSTHLCVAVYRPRKRITHCLQRCRTTLQITTLCRLKSPADWLKQWSEGRRQHGNWVKDLTWRWWHQQLLSKGARYHWCTYKHYAYVVHLSKNSHAACTQRYCSVMCSLGEKKGSIVAQTVPVILLKTKEPCSLSYVLIKGLIKSFLQLNEYLISQRAAMGNCDETQRTN